MASLGIGERPARRIAIDREDDADGDVYGDSILQSGAGTSLPVRHQHLHGAAVHPDVYSGPFLQQPSERTLRYEHPPPWLAPQCHAPRDCARGLQSSGGRGRLAYKAQVPWHDREQKVRPSTAGREHAPPTWCLPRILSIGFNYVSSYSLAFFSLVWLHEFKILAIGHCRLCF